MIRLGIVDDHAVIRAGLKEYFSLEADLRVVGEAGNGREAIELVKTTEMDVLVMDLSMPGAGGIDSLARIRAKAPNVGVLILTGHSESHYAVSLLQQGAAGFLNKECDPIEIPKAIRVIALGRRYISATVADLLVQKLEQKNDLPVHQLLSQREFQVFLKLAKGERLKTVADDLFLSIKTVSTYRSRIMDKMNLASNPDLTYYALKSQLIE